MEFSEEQLSTVDALPPLRNFLSSFAIGDIVAPLTLYEQEQLASKLLHGIEESQRKENDQYRLPQHLADVQRVIDPPSKLQNVTLPSVSLLTPRTRNRLAAVPKPNDEELSEVRVWERGAKSLGSDHVYQCISQAHPHTSAIDVSVASFIPVPLPNAPAVVVEEDKEALQHLIVPGFVDTSNIAVFTSNQYYDSIETERRRKALQQLMVQHLFYRPATALSSSASTSSLAENRSLTSAGSSLSHTTQVLQTLHSKTMSSFLLQPSKIFGGGGSSGEGGVGSHTAHPHSSKSRGKPFHKPSKPQLKPLTAATTQISVASRMQPNPLNTQAQSSVTGHSNVQNTFSQVDYLNAFSARVKDETGVDLNAKYNRHRLFLHNMEVLGVLWYKAAVYSALQQWKHVIRQMIYKQRTRALEKILNLFHRGLYWKRKREKERQLKLQSDAQHRRHLANQRFLNDQASVITRVVRRICKLHSIRKLLKKRRAATHLQRHTRGMIARRHFRRRRAAFLRRVWAAVKLQCAYRQRLANRQTRLIRKLRFVQRWLEELELIKDTHRISFARTGAESLIARYYRAHRVREKMRRLLHWSRFAKALTIQRVFRGHRSRQRVTVLKQDKRALAIKVHAASLVIQCLWRQHLARARVLAILEKKAADHAMKYRLKVERMSSGHSRLSSRLLRWRNQWRFLRTHCLSAAFVERKREYHFFATQIQRVFRAFHARHRVFILKAHRVWNRTQQQQRLESRHCLTIQRVFRGYRCRKVLRMRWQHANALILQCAFRCFVAKRRVSRALKINRQAKRLTRLLRRLIVRSYFLQRYRREQSLAVVAVRLQSFFRRCLAIRFVWTRRQLMNSLNSSKELLRNNGKLRKLRVYRERDLLMHTRIVQLLASIQLRIISETIDKPIEEKYFTVSKTACPCLGVLQALFVFCVCGHSVTVPAAAKAGGSSKSSSQKQRPLDSLFRVEAKLLPTFKADNSSLLKFLVRIQDCLVNSVKSLHSTDAQIAQLQNLLASSGETSSVSGKPGSAAPTAVLRSASDIPTAFVWTSDGGGLSTMRLNDQKELNYLAHSILDEKTVSLTSKGNNQKAPTKSSSRGDQNQSSSSSSKPTFISANVSQRNTGVTSSPEANRRSNSPQTALQRRMRPTSTPVVTDEDRRLKERERLLREREMERVQMALNALSLCLVNGDVAVPAIQKRLSGLEVDLLYSKCKSHTTNKLGYAEFLGFLDLFLGLHYESQNNNSNQQHLQQLGSEVVLDSEVRNDVATDGQSLESPAEEHNPSTEQESGENTTVDRSTAKTNNDSTLDDEDNEPFDLHRFAAKSIKAVHKSGFLSRFNLTSPLDVCMTATMTVPEPVDPTKDTFVDDPSRAARQVKVCVRNYKLALCVRILHSLRKEKAVSAILLWLERESIARLSLFVVRMQSLCRRRLAICRTEALRRERKEQVRQAAIAAQVTHLQAIARGFLARRRVSAKAQTILRKFVSLSSPPYWFNPKTQLRSLSKPTILGYREAFTVAVPEREWESVVRCVQCSVSLATVICEQCEESYCLACYDSLHCKGERTRHTRNAIPLCAYCQFQCASRSCVTCVVTPSKAQQERAFIRQRAKSAVAKSRSEKGISQPSSRPGTQARKLDSQRALEREEHRQREREKQQEREREAESGLEALRASLPAFQRGTYCDTCFLFAHDKYTQQLAQTQFAHQQQLCLESASSTTTGKKSTSSTVLSTASNRTVDVHSFHSLRRLQLMTTNQAYLLKYYPITRKPQTNHTFEALTQPCEECLSLSASWRCVQCEQVYCHTCLLTLHSPLNRIFASHTVEQLTYYTKPMHKSLLQDMAKRRFVNKWKQLLTVAGVQRAVHEANSALRIQSWWRMLFHGRRGKDQMRKRRKVLRSLYRERQRETQQIRNTLAYRWHDLFGSAPKLHSDSKEESALKGLPLIYRERRREYVYRNRADWGYFYPSSSSTSSTRQSVTEVISLHATRKPKRSKGVLKRGFAVGFEEEVEEQVRRGGYLLPGRVFPQVGTAVWRSTVDLRELLRRGEIVRVRSRLFGVVSVSEDSVRVNRLWRDWSLAEREEIKRERGGDSDMEDEHNGPGEEGAHRDHYAVRHNPRERRKREKAQRQREKLKAKEELRRRKELHKAQLQMKSGRYSRKEESLEERDETVDSESEEDEDEDNDEIGERLYRVPLYKNEDDRIYFYLRYKLYDWTIGNPLTQLSLRFYSAVALRKMRFALYMMKQARKQQRVEEAHEWKETALRESEAVKWAQALLDTGDPLEIALQAAERDEGGAAEESFNEDSEGIYVDEDEDEDEDDGPEDANGERSGDRKKPQIKAKSGNKSTVVPLDTDTAAPEELLGGGTEGEEADTKKKKKSKRSRLGKDSADKSKADSNTLSNDSASKKQKSMFSQSARQLRQEQQSEKLSASSASAKPLLKGASKADLEGNTTAKLSREPSLKVTEKNLKNPKKKKTNEKAAAPWYANLEQEQARKERERKMTPQEIAAEADDWKECIDPMTENVYWINVWTNEMLTNIPTSWAVRRQLEFEESKNKKSFDDAMKRIQHIELTTKNRLMLTGGRKR